MQYWRIVPRIASWISVPSRQIRDFLADSVDTVWHAACLFKVIAPLTKRFPMSFKLPFAQPLAALGLMALFAAAPAQAQETVKLGLVAAMSGQSAKSGE